MSVPRLALLLCLMLPLPGLAQDSDPSEAPAPPVTPPPLVPAPAEPQAPPDAPQAPAANTPEETPRGEIIPREWAPERASSPTAPRLVLEFFGGTLGGAVGIIPGGLLVLSSICFNGCDDGAETRGILGLAVGIAGFIGGTAGGIAGAASLVNGEGGFWPAAGGVAIGTLAGILLGAATAQSSEGAAVIPVLLGPVVGGMIGYEISHSNAEPRGDRASASGTRVMPLVSVHPSGGILGGLVGRF